MMTRKAKKAQKGIVINMESGEPTEEFYGHPVTVLVKLIEFAAKHSN